jgi:hypothetical protein
MPKSEQIEADASEAETTGQYRIVDKDNIFAGREFTQVSSGEVISGESYIPVVRDATPEDLVAVVVGIRTPEEKFMEWANNWVQDEPTAEVDSD